MGFLARLAGTAALGLAISTVRTAAAHPGVVCAWVAANVHLSGPLSSDSRTVYGSFVSNVGPSCFVDFTIHGTCFSSFGTGRLHDGVSFHPFSWAHSGNNVVFSNGVIGTSSFEPNVLNGESCLSVFGADDFLVTGRAVTPPPPE